MKKVMPTAVLLLLLLLFLVGACCKDDPDPCKDTKAAAQNFDMYLSMTRAGDSAETKFLIPEQLDTLYADRFGDSFYDNIFFEDTDPNTVERAWTVGGDVRTFTAQKFRLNFTNVMQGQAKEEIEVTLLRKRNVNKICFPDDDGLDTIRKKILIVDTRFYPLPQFGSYRIHPKGQEVDTFTIKISQYKTDPSQVGGFYVISNFPKGATRNSSDMPIGTGDKMSFFGNYFRLDSPLGISEIENKSTKYCMGYVKNGRIYIEYRLSNGIFKQYEGVKL